MQTGQSGRKKQDLKTGLFFYGRVWEKNGIIGYENIFSEPYDHFEFGRFIDIRLSKLQKDAIISTAVLRDRFPDRYWTPQQSSIRIRSKYAPDLWEMLTIN